MVWYCGAAFPKTTKLRMGRFKVETRDNCLPNWNLRCNSSIDMNDSLLNKKNGSSYAERLKYLIWFDFKSTVKRLILQVLLLATACNASPSLEVGAFVDK